jgi:hypothetical protein
VARAGHGFTFDPTVTVAEVLGTSLTLGAFSGSFGGCPGGATAAAVWPRSESAAIAPAAASSPVAWKGMEIGRHQRSPADARLPRELT